MVFAAAWNNVQHMWGTVPLTVTTSLLVILCVIIVCWLGTLEKDARYTSEHMQQTAGAAVYMVEQADRLSRDAHNPKAIAAAKAYLDAARAVIVSEEQLGDLSNVDVTALHHLVEERDRQFA